MPDHKRTVLFVTVGTSALYAHGLGNGLPKGNTSLKRLAKLCKDHHAANPTVPFPKLDTDALRNLAVEAHLHFWKERYRLELTSEAAEQTSAELTSTRLLARRDTEDPPILLDVFHRNRDHIVLLASDTAEGLLAAQVNAQVMVKEVFIDPLEGDPPSFADTNDSHNVHIRKIANLEAAGGFQGIANQLRNTLDGAIAHLGNDASFAVNMTGGYKGLIPPLVSQAYEREWSLYYQHLSAPQVVRLDVDADLKVTEKSRTIRSPRDH